MRLLNSGIYTMLEKGIHDSKNIQGIFPIKPPCKGGKVRCTKVLLKTLSDQVLIKSQFL